MQPRTNNAILVIGLLLILAIAAVALYVWTRDGAPPTAPDPAETDVPGAPETYENTAYRFSFTVPEEYETSEYTPERISVGTPQALGFDSVVDVSVLSTDDVDTAFDDFEDFLYNRTATLCAADGPTMSVSCTGVARSMPFQGANRTGIEFYLTEETRTIATGATTTVEKGPYFAYDISTVAGDATSTALVIHPPAAMEEADVDAALIRAIAWSVRVE